MDRPSRDSCTPPSDWRELVCVHDWRFLSLHLDDERLHDAHLLLANCRPAVRERLIAELRALLPAIPPGRALLIAAARVDHAIRAGG